MPALSDWLLGSAPCLVWVVFFRRKDDHEPEPGSRVLLALALGVAAAFLVLWTRPHLEGLLPDGASLRRDAFDAYLVTALAEESLKLLLVLPLLVGSREWDEPLDGIVYGAAVALGFAAVENAFYLASAGDAGLVLARAFTATLLHVGCTAGVAFALGCARLRRSPGPVLVLAFVLAVLAHGTYDLLLFALPQWSVVSLLVILPLLLAGLGAATRWARSVSPLYHPAREQAR